ncbi:beta-2-glycoprotein 1-like [Aplochiton taeniatus]
MIYVMMMMMMIRVCSRPDVSEGIELAGLQKFYSPGDEVLLSCQTGYTITAGTRTIICGSSGSWSEATLRCSPLACPFPDQLLNGEMEYEDIVYLSRINYTCNDGLPPLPIHGMMVYDRKVIGETTEYGFGGTYHCLPPLALIGNQRGVCGADGNWTEPPECRSVTCPPPKPIVNGYMSSNVPRDYQYKEKVKFGCNRNYVQDGNIEIVCQKTGDWSAGPVCKGGVKPLCTAHIRCTDMRVAQIAPCTIDIERGRILYKGEKLWIKDVEDKKVLHTDTVSFYCMDEERRCGYAVSAQCINGKLKIPDCFQQKSSLAGPLGLAGEVAASAAGAVRGWLKRPRQGPSRDPELSGGPHQEAEDRRQQEDRGQQEDTG